MRTFTRGSRFVRLALTVAGLAVLSGAPPASAGYLAARVGSAAEVHTPPAQLIQRVDDRGRDRSWASPGPRPGDGPSGPGFRDPVDRGPDRDYGSRGRGERSFDSPPANWRTDRRDPSRYDRRDAEDWGAAAAAGALGLDAIDNWAWRNSGPFPGAGDPDGPARMSAEPNPDEIAPPRARPAPGPNSIGAPSPTRIEPSGCYTLGADLICPNN